MKNISDISNFKSILKKKIVVVTFSKLQCPPCTVQKSYIDNIEANQLLDTSKFEFVLINLSNDEDVNNAIKFNVYNNCSTTPATSVYVNGILMKEFLGVSKSKEDLILKIKGAL